MSKQLNAESPKPVRRKACLHLRRSMVYLTVSGTLLLPISLITPATATNIEPTPESPPFLATPNTSNLTLKNTDKNSALATTSVKTLKSSFYRDIRAAIAAKWQASKVNNFINTLVNDDVTEIVPVSKNVYPESDATFKPFIGHSIVYDSNLLRIGGSDGATQGTSGRAKNDLIKQIRAGIAAKWNIKRQILLIKAVIAQNWFATYNELDYLGRDIKAQWNWQIGKYLNGEIGYGNVVSLGSYGQLNALINNLQTQNLFFANGEYQFLSGWFLRGGLTHQRSSYSTQALRYNNLNETTAEVGIKHVSPDNNMLGFRVDLTDGRFPERNFTPGSTLDDAFTRNEFNIDWAWRYSIKTLIDGKVGYTQQNFEHLSSRNFSEPIARANINWEITGKTALVFSGWREIQLANTLNASFIVSQGVKISPQWLATPKLQFSLPMSYENQDYLGDPGFIAKAQTADQDNISSIGLKADYIPIEKAKVSLFWLFENRSSTVSSRNYDSNAVGLDLQLGF